VIILPRQTLSGKTPLINVIVIVICLFQTIGPFQLKKKARLSGGKLTNVFIDYM
jgi:hypothetical protein